MGRDPFVGLNPQAAGTAKLLLKLLAEAGGSLNMRGLSQVKRMFRDPRFRDAIAARLERRGLITIAEGMKAGGSPTAVRYTITPEGREAIEGPSI